jgi:hypothetical protein
MMMMMTMIVHHPFRMSNQHTFPEGGHECGSSRIRRRRRSCPRQHAVQQPPIEAHQPVGARQS